MDNIEHTGAWCSGITSASHAEGPGFKSQCVHIGIGRVGTWWVGGCGVGVCVCAGQGGDRGGGVAGGWCQFGGKGGRQGDLWGLVETGVL